MKKKRNSLFTSILWAAVTAVWTATVCMNVISGDKWGFLMALQCACILVSGANAVVGFVRYKRASGNVDKR